MSSRGAARKWPVQDAKARFSEFLEASLTEGPQIVTRRGVEEAVLVPESAPELAELIRQATQATVLHNDDTRMRVLRMERETIG